MDWKQFFAAVVGSIAWPAAIIITVLMLKAPLAKLLPKIRSFKYGDLHIDLEQQLAEVKAEVTASEPEPLLADQPLPPPSALELAAISPRSAVLMAWIEVEKKIREMASQYGLTTKITPNGQIRPLMLTDSMRQLFEKGIVNELTFNTYRKLNRIRNEAAHMTSKEIEYDEAVAMSEMCQWLLKSLDYSSSPPS